MAPATASDDVVALLKQRKAEFKADHKALDAEEKRVDRAISALNGTPKRLALNAGPATASAKAKAKPIAKRKRAGGTRAEQAKKMIDDAGTDGIDASKIAKKMKIKPNYLYRVLGTLEGEGLVRKEGRVYFAA